MSWRPRSSVSATTWTSKVSDYIPAEQWIEIVAAIGYDESSDPAVLRAIERGAELAIAAELERIAVCVDGGVDPAVDPWTKGEARGRRYVRRALYARAAQLRGGVIAHG